jgi:hypothetical protein
VLARSGAAKEAEQGRADETVAFSLSKLDGDEERI